MTQRCDWPCNVQCSKEIFGDNKNAVDISALDSENCVAGKVTTATSMPGYGRKL